jgi:hypothetical protein
VDGELPFICAFRFSQEAVTEIGSRVRFSAGSVFLPNLEEAVGLFSRDDYLEGTIASFSDSGASSKVFAIVEVVRKLSLVVPVDDLILISGPER